MNAERGGWGSALKKRNGKHTEASCIYAIREQGWECPDCKCSVTLTFIEPHANRDPDNIFGGAKFILDGITKPRGKKKFGAGAIQDDSQKWMELHFGEIVIDKEMVGCNVLIETIGD